MSSLAVGRTAGPRGLDCGGRKRNEYGYSHRKQGTAAAKGSDEYYARGSESDRGGEIFVLAPVRIVGTVERGVMERR